MRRFLWTLLSMGAVFVILLVFFPSAVKKITPSFVKTYVKDLLGISEMQEHIKVLEKAVYEPKETTRERSRERWSQSKPDDNLSWGNHLSGDAFIEKAEHYKIFSENRSILEIGPGYGRILKSILDRKDKFKTYTGVDISAGTIEFLTKEFRSPNTDFICADAELVQLPHTYDIVISSLTFKHFYPTFEKTIINLDKFLNKDAYYVFDLLEGEGSYFENDGKTYIHKYTKTEIETILKNCSLQLVAFDEVKHDEQHSRLLVIAGKIKK